MFKFQLWTCIPSSETRFAISKKMMKAINRLELASMENNKRFHNDFKKLHEEITVIFDWHILKKGILSYQTT